MTAAMLVLLGLITIQPGAVYEGSGTKHVADIRADPFREGSFEVMDRGGKRLYQIKPNTTGGYDAYEGSGTKRVNRFNQPAYGSE